MSAVTPSPVPGDSAVAEGHRLTTGQADEIALRVPWKAGELPPWLRTLYVRAVDAGRPWVETYLTPKELTAIREEIERTAPRNAEGGPHGD